ncbi:MAG: helix-turn-helix domain-containing protein [Verrucomicrobiia bacterium]
MSVIKSSKSRSQSFSVSSSFVVLRRAVKGWSQMMLANRSGVARTTISAIEGGRLTPSVTTALALARALECSVEELFGGVDRETISSLSHWAWMPRGEASRYWEAEVSGRHLLYPVEELSCNSIPHDGVWYEGVEHATKKSEREKTLVMACCDPAAGLLASEYARASGFRLIIFSRGGSEALDLLKRGLVHVAGLHRSTREQPDRNEETVRDRLGENFQCARGALARGLVTHNRVRAVARS